MQTPPPRRRQILDYALGGTVAAVAAAAAYPAVRMLEPLEEGDQGVAVVGALAELAPGEARVVQIGPRPVLVVRARDGTVRAFVAVCPHLGCTVHHDAERGDIACACHGGRFSVDGNNTSGPPTRPLVQLRVALHRGVITVSAT
jgi:cytochrome b6-f complex iron-sulfur subunit